MNLRKLINRFVAGLSARGPYRFLVRNWSGLDDIDLVSGVLGTETFRSMLHSQHVPVNVAQSVVVLAPHQDDEVIGAGGFCIQARKQGAEVSMIFITNGAETGLGRQFGEPKLPEDVARIRADEARAVCAHLGATYLELGIDNVAMNVAPTHVDKLAELLDAVKPDVVLLPWLLDGSPKHRMVNHLLWLVCRHRQISGFEVWGYQVNNGLLANGVLDITNEIDEKIELLRLYVSQNELLRRYDYQAWGLAAWNARFLPSKNKDQTAHYAELFCMLPLNEHLRLIERFYFKDLRRTYFGNSKLTTKMSALHQRVSGSGA